MAASSFAKAKNLGDTGASIRSVFERSFRSGETIYDEGQDGDALFVIRPDGTIHSAHVGVVTPEALESAVEEWAG